MKLTEKETQIISKAVGDENNNLGKKLFIANILSSLISVGLLILILSINDIFWSYMLIAILCVVYAVSSLFSNLLISKEITKTLAYEEELINDTKINNDRGQQ